MLCVIFLYVNKIINDIDLTYIYINPLIKIPILSTQLCHIILNFYLIRLHYYLLKKIEKVIKQNS